LSGHDGLGGFGGGAFQRAATRSVAAVVIPWIGNSGFVSNPRHTFYQGDGMAFAGFGVWSLVGQQLAGAIAGAIFLWSMSSYRPSLKFSWPHFRELFGFSSSVFAVSILWFFSMRLDQIIIGRFAGMPALGLYSIAGKLPNLANMMVKQPLAIVALPSLSTLQDDHVKMRQAVYHGMELNAVISFAVFVGLAAIAPDLVTLLFGAKWADAGMLCSLLALYSLTDVLQTFFYPILLASGGIGKYVWLNVSHFVGVLAACLIGIQFGVVYLVLGLIINSMVNAIPGLLFIRKRVGVGLSSYCKPCLIPALSSLFMLGVIWLVATMLPTDIGLVLRLAGKTVIGAIAYLGCIFFLSPSSLKKLADTIGHAFNRSNTLTEAPIGTMAK
jgi:O-antigen/teichoic acid export membrane protein